MEELHSADNPAEIAHGFPVPEVENKHTRVEYLMKGAWEVQKGATFEIFLQESKTKTKPRLLFLQQCGSVVGGS